MTHRDWSTVLDVDPAPLLLRERQPMMVVMGGEDEDVPIDSSFLRLPAAIEVARLTGHGPEVRARSGPRPITAPSHASRRP